MAPMALREDFRSGPGEGPDYGIRSRTRSGLIPKTARSP